MLSAILMPALHANQEGGRKKCNMKYSRVYKDIGYIIVFVPVFMLSVFVIGIRFVDVQNPQRGVLETCVNASDVLFPTTFPPPPSASASDLTFEEDVIDADSANVELPEPGDVQFKLQHAFAALYLHHNPSDTIEPRMLWVDIAKVLPKTYTIQSKDTLLATLMHKKFARPTKIAISVLTTHEAVGKTMARKHETS